MKYVILVGDGMADYPLAELEGRTPLQEADIPNLDFIAKNGRCGLARTVPDGFIPGSDVANLSILGYDPKKYYTGRGPLEAASMGVSLRQGDVAFRCNLITEKDGMLADYSAGHITTEEARALILAVDSKLSGTGVKFYPGVSYRHLLVLNQGEQAVCMPPHDVVGQPIKNHVPRGDGSAMLIKLMKMALPILESHSVNMDRIDNGKSPGNWIWPWGQGRTPSMPTLTGRYGISGSVITAVDLIKGMGKYAGLHIIDVPGATGYFDTNYEGKAEYALKSLETRDFVFVHVESPDEAGHVGNLEAKLRAIEDFDRRVVGKMLDGLAALGEHRVLVLPDHFTPIPVKTHTGEPVPFALYATDDGADHIQAFDEASARDGSLGLVEGHRLMELLMRKHA